MFKIDPPALSAGKALTIALSKVRQPEKRNKYESIRPNILSCCDAYDALARTGQLGDAIQKDFLIAGLNDRDMPDLYEDHFRRTREAGELRLPELDSCPCCGLPAQERNLDHYLPKSKYHGVSVHPNNLVPTCSACNGKKLAKTPKAALNPYFDTIAFSTRWLYATLIPPRDEWLEWTAEFHVCSSLLSPEIRDRIEGHMQLYNLWERFRVAAQGLFTENQNLQENTSILDAMEMKDYLRREASRTSPSSPNSYKRATFEAMAENDQYIQYCIQFGWRQASRARSDQVHSS